MIRKGGYIIVDLTSTNLYANLQEAIATQKPILLVDGVHTPLYTTTIVQGTNKIIINGQYVVNNDNTTSGALTGLVLEGIYDKDGNPRFIDDDLLVNDTLPTGVEVTYAKWSLSGTHLMIVIAGTIEDNTSVAPITGLAVANLPQFIKDKIYPMTSQYLGAFNGQIVNTGTYSVTGSSVNVDKVNDGLRIDTNSTITSTDNSLVFRYQIDLLIDNE